MPWALLQYRCVGPFGLHLGGIHRRDGFLVEGTWQETTHDLVQLAQKCVCLVDHEKVHALNEILLGKIGFDTAENEC